MIKSDPNENVSFYMWLILSELNFWSDPPDPK